MRTKDEIGQIFSLLENYHLKTAEKEKAVTLINDFYILKKEVDNGLSDNGIRLYVAVICAGIVSGLCATQASNAWQLSLFSGVGNLLGHYIGKEIGRRYLPSDLNYVLSYLERRLDSNLPVKNIFQCLQKLNQELDNRYFIQNVDHLRIYLAAIITIKYTSDNFKPIFSFIWAFLCDYCFRPFSISEAIKKFKKDISNCDDTYREIQDNTPRRYLRM